MYIVLFGLVCIVYARLLPKAPAGPSSAGMVKEIEETMEHFAAELEEENKQLLQSVTQMKHDHEQQVSKLSGKIEQLEKQSYDLSQELKKLIISKIQEAPLRPEPEASRAAERGAPAAEETAAYGITASAAAEAEAALRQAAAASDAPQPSAAAAGLRERYEGLFQLYDQGKSTEYIAKKLGLNKGEVSLIVQLAKQEEQGRV